MTPSQLTPEILERMKPADRQRLGVQTQGEAEGKFIVRNERQLQVQISNLLNQRGIWHYCARTDRKTTCAKGTPDFLAVVNSVPIAWEVKFDGGKLRPEQERARDKMISNGWQWRLITNLEAARAHLDAISTTYIG